MNNSSIIDIEIQITYDVFYDHSYSHSNPLPPYKDEYIEKGNTLIKLMRAAGIEIPNNVELKYHEVVDYSFFQTTYGRIIFNIPIAWDLFITTVDNVKIILEKFFKCHVEITSDASFKFSNDFLTLIGDINLELDWCSWREKVNEL